MEKKRLVVLAATFVAALLPTALAQRYGEWLAPVHLDWGVNTDWADMNPIVSRDGLTLYFARGDTPGGGTGTIYYYVAHRPSVDAPWGPPVFLGDILGNALFISRDGHRAYFSRKVDGKDDLFVSRRRDENDDFGWGEPENLGSQVNTPANEYYPSLHEDEEAGMTVLYFTSDRAGSDDIYASTLSEDGIFGDPVPIVELNTPAVDRQAHVRRDGLECVLTSNRVGSMLNLLNKPSYDLWVATRASTSDHWSAPVNMGTLINTGRYEAFPSYSFDGSQLYFHGAQRVGNFDSGDVDGVGCPLSATCYFDIWVVTREKSDGSERR